MKLGTFMMPLHPPEKDRTACFEEDVDFIVRADQLGYTEAWIGQHHTVAWEPIPSNDLFISHVLPQTKNIRLGTGVSIMPQHHPVNVAVRLAFLDHLSKGRINCGFGQGGVATDWGLFDLPDPKTQGLMTVESIDMVLKLWQEDAPFDFQGDFYHIKIEAPQPELGIGELLKPYQQPHPPIGMSVIRGDSMAATMAGQRGYLPISTNLVAASTLTQHWQTYSAGATDAGLPEPQRTFWRISRSILVGDSEQQAWDYALDPQSTFNRAFEYLIAVLSGAQMLHIMKHDESVADAEVTPEYLIRNLCIIGDTKSCVQQLEALWQTTGGFDTLLMIAHDWDDRPLWERSMALLANEVVPKLPSV
ncbi:MAG TPA: LLM class flavin-dependent oxidoreductase [Candidatus Handelsmanbacteria bacterium]|nr:LLM class flavin-dependent oxidoreductase [Candidatus Handelsmanbacteria bacterium]